MTVGTKIIAIDYEVAKNEVFKKIEPQNLRILSDYVFLDLENEIEYELKSVFIKN